MIEREPLDPEDRDIEKWTKKVRVREPRRPPPLKGEAGVGKGNRAGQPTGSKVNDGFFEIPIVTPPAPPAEDDTDADGTTSRGGTLPLEVPQKSWNMYMTGTGDYMDVERGTPPHHIVKPWNQYMTRGMGDYMDVKRGEPAKEWYQLPVPRDDWLRRHLGDVKTAGNVPIAVPVKYRVKKAYAANELAQYLAAARAASLVNAVSRQLMVKTRVTRKVKVPVHRAFFADKPKPIANRLYRNIAQIKADTVPLKVGAPRRGGKAAIDHVSRIQGHRSGYW